jgi:MIF4G domain
MQAARLKKALKVNSRILVNSSDNILNSIEMLESGVIEKLEVTVQPSPRKLLTRYKREDLIELMDEELSIVAPHLSDSVHKLLSNSNSCNFLADTVSDECSARILMRKSSSTSAFEQSSSQEPSLLMKSISLQNPTRDNVFGAGDGWNQIGTGEKALRTFRSCLNKLTADNFEAVLAEVKRMRVSSDSTILSFIELLYDKAILEPTYAMHYVQLTMALKNIFTIGPESKSFEHFAIVACQRGFEEAMKKLHNVNQMDDENKDKLRHGLSGSIQFIAKMYLNRILTRRIMMEICESLLKLECTEAIEPLCKLLEISGGKLEKDAPPKNEKLNAVIKRLDTIASKFPTRIKFMIQNLIDQRKNGWKPRFGKDGPKKLDQVANECGFVKRLGTVGRYDELEVKPDSQQHRTDTNNRGDHFRVRGNRDGFQGNRSRAFRGRRGGRPFAHNKN